MDNVLEGGNSVDSIGKMIVTWDFLGGPMVESLPCNSGDVGLIPGWGTMILYTADKLSLQATTTEPEL